MPLGDILEWLSAAALVAAAYLFGGLGAALGATAVVLFYLAQVYDHVSVRPRLRRKKDEP